MRRFDVQGRMIWLQLFRRLVDIEEGSHGGAVPRFGGRLPVLGLHLRGWGGLLRPRLVAGVGWRLLHGVRRSATTAGTVGGRLLDTRVAWRWRAGFLIPRILISRGRMISLIPGGRVISMLRWPRRIWLAMLCVWRLALVPRRMTARPLLRGFGWFRRLGAGPVLILLCRPWFAPPWRRLGLARRCGVGWRLLRLARMPGRILRMASRRLSCLLRMRLRT